MNTQGGSSVKDEVGSVKQNGWTFLALKAFFCYGGPFSHSQNEPTFSFVTENKTKQKTLLQFIDQMNDKQPQIYISINMSLNLLILRSHFQWLHHFSILFELFMCPLNYQIVISLVLSNYVLFSLWYHCGNTYILCSFILLGVNTDHLLCNFIRSLKISFICGGLNKEFIHALEEWFLLLCIPDSTNASKYFTSFMDRVFSLKSLLTEIKLGTGLYNHDYLIQKLTKEFFFTHSSFISHIQLTM